MCDVSICLSHMGRITLLGVHHRHQVSIAEVEDSIVERMPGAVAVELPSDDYLKFLEVRSYLETEMKVAMLTACEIGAEVYLIDLRKAHLERRLRECLKISDLRLWEGFQRGDLPAFYRRLLEIAPELIPLAKEVLLLDREAAMAAKLLRLGERYEEVLAVVGYSHTGAIQELLANREKLREILRRRGLSVGEPFHLKCDEVLIYG